MKRAKGGSETRETATWIAIVTSSGCVQIRRYAASRKRRARTRADGASPAVDGSVRVSPLGDGDTALALVERLDWAWRGFGIDQTESYARVRDHGPALGFRDAFPIFQTTDVERLASFYCSRLGFERGYRFPETGPVQFLVVSLGALSIGLTQVQSPDEVGRVALWLYTDDVDHEVDRLRASGGTVVDEPTDREWGERTATVADPDGNLLHIGSR